MNRTVLKEVEFPREERTMSHSIIGLQQSLERINTLPAMPVIAQKMLALALNTDEGETQLLKLIAQDPQISAKICLLYTSPSPRD